MTTELKAAFAVSSPWEQATLWVNDQKVAWGAKLVLLRGQENDVKVEAPPAIARALNLGLPEDGDLNIVASPSFGNWVAPVNGKFNWKITPDAGKSGRIKLAFFSTEETQTWEPKSRVISSNLADEVTVLLNGNVMPLRGANFIGGQANLITLGHKNQGLLHGVPLAIDVIPQSGLVTSDFTCEPALRQLTTTHEWKLTGKQLQSGTFKLKLFSEGEKASLLTPTNRLSREVFRFIESENYDLLLPPEEVSRSRGLDYVFLARLLKSDGSPSTSVLVTFTGPEGKKFKTETGADGVARSEAYRFNTSGVYLIKAEAELPAGVTPLEVKVRVT
jgi:hypothetical protein